MRRDRGGGGKGVTSSVCVTVLAVTIGGALGIGQSPDRLNTASEIFRSRTDLVALDVSVKSRRGEAVPSLNASDFLVLEDNVPQRIAVFSVSGRLPLAVVLLVDGSRSMTGERLAGAKAGTSSFLRALEADDLVEVIAFNQHSRRIFPLGTNRDVAEQSLSGVFANGTTALYDAATVALADLKRVERERPFDYRKAVVILSDGDDTASHVTFEDLLEDGRRNNVAIETISLRTDEHNRWLPPSWALAELAFNTGGRAIKVERLEDLPSIFAEIAAELRLQYRLGYASSSAANDGRWRRISVRMTSNALLARTRAGYYAPHR